MTQRSHTDAWRSLDLVLALSMLGAGCERRPATPFATCTVQGIDVSRHQGTIDWQAVANAGVRFAWIKATEGGDHLDPMFRRNWILARDAGVRRGAYHFVYWCRPARDQADWFIANVPADPDALPPVLDVEWNPGSRSCPNKVSRDRASAEVGVMLAAMERAYGRTPILYAPADLYAEVLSGTFDAYPLWARSLDAPPEALYAARPWTIWQYSETGRVPGITGSVDRNCRAEPQPSAARTRSSTIAP